MKMSAFRAALVCLLIVPFLGACDLLSPDTEDPTSALQEVPVASLLDGAFTLVPNPSGVAPLTATLAFRTETPTQVEVTVLGETPLGHRFEALATTHEVPLLGLYPDTLNQIAVRVTDPEAGYGLDTLTLRTPPLPPFFPDIAITAADTARMEPGVTLSGFSIGNAGVFESYPLLYDATGTVRWYLDLSAHNDIAFPVQRVANGNFILGDREMLYEYDMRGHRLNTWTLTGYRQHHELIEKPDGNLIVAVDVDGRATIEDHIIEIDRATGSVVREWDLRQILDIHRRNYSGNVSDWFHMNAIWYDAADDALIISGRNQGVVKVTMDNELVWILAPHAGWGQAGVAGDGEATAPFLLTAVDANGQPYADDIQRGAASTDGFSWGWGQHAPMILPNGNLFLFDNGALRDFNNDAPFYSQGIEYALDEDAMTVRAVWSYGQTRGDGYYAPAVSDVDYLPATGNRLIMPGIIFPPVSGAYVTEVTYPGKEVVFEAHLAFKNLYGNGQGWGQIDVVYRSERLPLYPD